LPEVAHRVLVERNRQWAAQVGVGHRDDGSLAPSPVFGGLHDRGASTAATVVCGHRQGADDEPGPGQVALQLPAGVRAAVGLYFFKLNFE